jgi:hypothetical protein
MKKFAKILVFIVAVALVFGVIGVSTFAVDDHSDGITLYLKPNSNWTQSNARFAVYTWDGGDKWFNLTSAGDGYYTVTIPAGISNIIFCRMNPSTTANNWNNKWNQTADLKVQTNGNNCYTVKAGTWDKGGGTWSKFTCAHTNVAGSEVVLKAPTCTETGLTQYTCSKCGDYTVVTGAKGHSYSNNKCTVCGAFAPYTVAGATSSGAASIFGTAWDTTNTANDMTYDEATGAYTKVYTNVPAGTYKFKCAQDHAWNVAYPGSDKQVTVSKAGSTLTITLKGTTVTTSVVAPVAKIGSDYYFDIPSALAAAQDGDTVTLLAGTYTANLSVNKAITVVGETTSAGTKRVTIKGKLSVTANGATVKNINVDNGSSTAGYVSGSDILIEGCTVKGSNGFRYCYTNGVVTFKNSVITGSTYGIHFDGNAGGEIVIDGCTITGWTSFAGTINKVSMVDTSFEKGNYNYIRFYQKEVVLDGCTFNESMQVDLAVSEANVTVDNCVVENGGEAAKLFSNGDIVASNIVVDETKLLPLYAQINGVDYRGSYNDVFNAAVDGDEVTIVAKGTYKLLVSGKNITVTGGVDGVVFEGMGAYGMGGANVTFNNITFNWTNDDYKGLQHSGNLVYNNCTINGQVFLYGNSEIFNECTFNQTSAGKYNVWTYGAKHVEFNKCTFNSAGKALLVYTEASTHFIDLAITETTFNASELVAGKAAIEIDTSLTAGANISIDAATIANGFDAGNVSGNTLWNNKKGNATDKNNDIIITVAGEEVLAPLPYEVTIGSTKYTSIQAAIDAAKSGDEISIYNDLVLTNSLYINNKTVTINLNKHTLTYGGTNLRAAAAIAVLTNNATLIVKGNGTVLTNGAIFSIEDGSEVQIVDGTYDVDVTPYLAEGYRVATAPQADGTILYGVVTNTDKTFIGENGNWWVGEYDTGIAAQPKVEIVEVDGVKYWHVNGINTGYLVTPTDAVTPEIKVIDGVWHIDIKDGNGFQSTSVVAGAVDGNGIVSIEKTESNGLIDIYTITYNDGTTTMFTIQNGSNGANGPTGPDGISGNQGPKGDRGQAGANGASNTWFVNSALYIALGCIALAGGVVLVLNYKRTHWWG